MSDRTIECKGAIRAKKWLLNSGIQNMEGPKKGGFNSWFDMDGGGYSYVYSEITGYGITTLLFLKEYFNDEDYIEKASAAAEWLMANALSPSGGVRTRDYFFETEESHLYSFDSDNIYAFDNGMVLYGIVNLYRATKDERYLDFAAGIADFMIDKMLRPDGTFYPIYNDGSGAPENTLWKWSSQSGSYHAKLALGFLDMHAATGNEKYKDTAVSLCRRSLSFQEDSGRFVTSQADGSTHMHPHSYSAEGLLYAGKYLGDNTFVESALSATKWALDNQHFDGGIPKKMIDDKFVPYYRSDILAQILRLGIIFTSMEMLDEEYVSKLEKLHDKLIGFQHVDDSVQSGGFLYGTALDGSSKKHLNSWCTMFAVQALIMYESFFSYDDASKNLECFI